MEYTVLIPTKRAINADFIRMMNAHVLRMFGDLVKTYERDAAGTAYTDIGGVLPRASGLVIATTEQVKAGDKIYKPIGDTKALLTLYARSEAVYKTPLMEHDFLMSPHKWADARFVELLEYLVTHVPQSELHVHNAYATEEPYERLTAAKVKDLVARSQVAMVLMLQSKPQLLCPIHQVPMMRGKAPFLESLSPAVWYTYLAPLDKIVIGEVYNCGHCRSFNFRFVAMNDDGSVRKVMMSFPSTLVEAKVDSLLAAARRSKESQMRSQHIDFLIATKDYPVLTINMPVMEAFLPKVNPHYACAKPVVVKTVDEYDQYMQKLDVHKAEVEIMYVSKVSAGKDTMSKAMADDTIPFIDWFAI